MNPKPFPIPENESLRLDALNEYDILDSFTEKDYDFLTQMASHICKTPVSLITLLGVEKQFVKSSFGFDVPDLPREMSFCNYTILDPEKVNVVSDLRLDERYNSNPLVLGEPHAVFYAGAPLVTPEGFVLGSICVLDAVARKLSPEQEEALKALARQTITTMELRKKNHELSKAKEHLKKCNERLNEYVKVVSHDIKTPLANITMLSKGFKRNYNNVLDETGTGYIELIQESSSGLILFLDEMLLKTKKEMAGDCCSTPVNTKQLLDKVIKFLAPTSDIEIKVEGSFPKLQVDELALQQVFQNLITNAIKYNDKEKAQISIFAESDHQYYYFHVIDNGCGIASCDLDIIFIQQQTLNKTDRYGNKGTGIGLAKVKNIVDALGGNISVVSELNKGTDFKICIPMFTEMEEAI